MKSHWHQVLQIGFKKKSSSSSFRIGVHTKTKPQKLIINNSVDQIQRNKSSYSYLGSWTLNVPNTFQHFHISKDSSRGNCSVSLCCKTTASLPWTDISKIFVYADILLCVSIILSFYSSLSLLSSPICVCLSLSLRYVVCDSFKFLQEGKIIQLINKNNMSPSWEPEMKNAPEITENLFSQTQLKRTAQLLADSVATTARE